jgi:hypothetical protein
MLAQFCRLVAFATLLVVCLLGTEDTQSQEVLPPPTPNGPVQAPAVPRGVEVLDRGPIHEAFATPTGEPKPTQLIPKKPPAPLEEMPPEEKPEGDAVWVGGYFAWDDERHDFLWVSGCWRTKPAGKDWVPGYWREVGEQWQWVPGFWTVVQQGQPAQVTYNPEPPAPPQIAAPPPPPAPDQFYVPGYWMWTGDRYAWRAGYYTAIRPGYVYVASHYRWTPYGYVFVPGYWDLAVSRRGLLYAPVVVTPGVVGAGFVYTPSYAVTDTIVLDAMFVRPAYCHYYFGNYYGPRYVTLGFEPCVVYSRRYYDPIIVYRRWEYRDNPRWIDIQINLYHERVAGRAPIPGRVVVLAPARTVLVTRRQNFVVLNERARADVRAASVAHHQALAAERRRLEPPGHAAAPVRPHTAALSHPAAAAAHPGHAPGALHTPQAGMPGHPGAPAHPGGPAHPAGPGTPANVHPGVVGAPHVMPKVQPRPAPRTQDDHKKKA